MVRRGRRVRRHTKHHRNRARESHRLLHLRGTYMSLELRGACRRGDLGRW